MLVTLLLLAPVWWAVMVAPLPATLWLPIWLFVLLPWALRDVWRRVQVEPADPGVPAGTVSAIEPPSPDAAASIQARQGPIRW